MSSPLHNASSLFQSGKAGQAAEIIEKLLSVQPDNFDALVLLGVIRAKTGNPEAAILLFENALEINPGNAGVHSNIGNVLEALGRLDNAVASHRHALQIDPGSAMLHSNLGNALRRQGLFDDAVASHKRALELNPNIASIHNNLGYALEQQGLLNDAVASFNKALTINPLYAEAHNNLGSAFLNLGRSDEAVASYRKALAIHPDFVRAQSNLIFSLNYIAYHSPADTLTEARRFGAMVTAQATPVREHANDPSHDRRLRIGLVSGDLRRHSVGYFLKSLLPEIDKENFEIFAYATSDMEDDTTDHIKSIVSHWRKVAVFGDKQLAETIIGDGIDILVDLSGHTDHNRLRVFAMKPAPIQVTWLGYGGTTGVEAMDYVFCDPLILPPSEEADFTEKPWRLPDVWVCFSPPGLEIDVGAAPALMNGHITFGSFNNLTKVSGRTVDCWAKVLEAVPDSRLLLKAKQLGEATVQEETRARFEAHGIGRERLILKSRSPGRAAHLRTYQEMDFALDPFPYAGAVTSIEAFWMGTPVLTMKGDRFVSHMGDSLVHNMGLDEWIADTPEDYVEKARIFASDLKALSVLRESLRNRLLESPICDAPRFAGNLEEAFRGMWRKWCTAESA